MGSGVRGEVTSLHHSASEWQSGAYSPGLRAPRAHTFTTREAMFFPVLEELLEKTDVQRVEREEREGRGRRNGSGPSTAGRGRMVSPGEPVGKAGQTSCPLGHSGKFVTAPDGSIVSFLLSFILVFRVRLLHGHAWQGGLASEWAGSPHSSVVTGATCSFCGWTGD